MNNFFSFLVLFLLHFTEAAIKRTNISISNRFIKDPLKTQCSLNGIHILEVNPINNVNVNVKVNVDDKEGDLNGVGSLKITFKANSEEAESELFETSVIESYTDSDQLSFRLELTLLRSKYVNLSLRFYSAEREEEEVDHEFSSNWLTLSASSTVKSKSNSQTNNVLQISNGNLYLNGRKVDLNLKPTHSDESEDFEEIYREDLNAERPVEWDDFENDPEINYMPLWQPPLIITSTPSKPAKMIQSPNKKEQEKVQLNSLLKGVQVEYFAFDEEDFEAVEYSFTDQHRISKPHSYDPEEQITAIASVALKKEHLLYVASISAFLSYLLVMLFLSKMTSIKPKRALSAIESITPATTQTATTTTTTTNTMISNSQSRLPVPLHKSQLNRSKPSIPSALHIEIHTSANSNPSVITASPAGNVLHLQIPSITANSVTAAGTATTKAASFTLSDNRHILFPSKLGNYPK